MKMQTITSSLLFEQRLSYSTILVESESDESEESQESNESVLGKRRRQKNRNAKRLRLHLALLLKAMLLINVNVSLTSRPSLPLPLLPLLPPATTHIKSRWFLNILPSNHSQVVFATFHVMIQPRHLLSLYKIWLNAKKNLSKERLWA